MLKSLNLQSSVAKIFFFAVALVLTQGRVANSETSPTGERLCVEQLPEQINQIIAKTEPTARWGIMIQPQFSQGILYQRNAEQFFIPASNMKLFPTAIAAHELSPDFQIVTPIFYQGEAPDLKQLRIVGQGDPSFTTSDLETLATVLQEKGVRSIETVVLETGYFPSPAINSSWEWEDVYAAYGTAVNSLMLDENAVTLTVRPQAIGEPVTVAWNNPIAASQWNLVNEAMTAPPNTDYQVQLQGKLGTSQLYLTGSLPQDIKTDVWQLAIPNPDHYFRDVLLASFAQKQIQVNHVHLIDSNISESRGNILMNVTSPDLVTLSQEINRNSNNLYAEALFKYLEVAIGRERIEEQLTQLGVSSASYRFGDGSGLSRRNLVTPSAIAQLLQGMLHSPHAEIFRRSLAVAGVNGTLKNRLRSTPLQGNLQGKTGTLTGISALSGYVNPPHYEPLVFSILLNHSQLSASQQRAIIDQILLLLSQLQSCSPPDR